MGFRHLGTENGWYRYGTDEKSGGYIDLRETPKAARGAWGTRSIHHLAWRVDDEAHQLEVRKRVVEGGAQPTPVIDRFWFKSVYFREPGGVFFELTIEGPSFRGSMSIEHASGNGSSSRRGLSDDGVSYWRSCLSTDRLISPTRTWDSTFGWTCLPSTRIPRATNVTGSRSSWALSDDAMARPMRKAKWAGLNSLCA